MACCLDCLLQSCQFQVKMSPLVQSFFTFLPSPDARRCFTFKEKLSLRVRPVAERGLSFLSSFLREAERAVCRSSWFSFSRDELLAFNSETYSSSTTGAETVTLEITGSYLTDFARLVKAKLRLCEIFCENRLFFIQKGEA